MADSTPERIMVQFRAVAGSGLSARSWGRDVLRAANARGKRSTSDAVADSLTAILIAANRTSAGADAPFNHLAFEALIALGQSGGPEPGRPGYPGAYDRLMRVYVDAPQTGGSRVFPYLLYGDPQRGAAFLKELGTRNAYVAIEAVRALCFVARLDQHPPASRTAARLAILDLLDGKLTTWDNASFLRTSSVARSRSDAPDQSPLRRIPIPGHPGIVWVIG